MIIYNGKPVLEERAKKFLTKLFLDDEEKAEKVYNSPDCIDGLLYAMDVFLPDREMNGIVEVFFTGRTFVDWGKEIGVSRSRARDIVNKALTRLRINGFRYIINGLTGYRDKVAREEAERERIEQEKEQKRKEEEEKHNLNYIKTRPTVDELPLTSLYLYDFCNVLSSRAKTCLDPLGYSYTVAYFESGRRIYNCGEKTAENIKEAIKSIRNIYDDERFITKLRRAYRKAQEEERWRKEGFGKY